MVICFLVFALMFFYFELLGQSILSKLDLAKRKSNLFVGFFFYTALVYVLFSLLNTFHVSSIIVALGYFGLIIVGLILIIKQRNMLKIDVKHIAIVFIVTFVLSIYSYNTTLGNIDGFDSLTYINLVSSFSLRNNILTTDLSFGGRVTSSVSNIYNYQVYYIFASLVVYATKKIAGLCNIVVLNSTLYIWIFQFLFDALLTSIALTIFDVFKNKKKIVNYLLFVLLILVFGRLYYNNALGFFGNSYRTLAMSSVFLEIYEYFKENNKTNLLLFFVFLLSMCGFSSSGAFSLMILLFGMLFVLVKDNPHIFKYYAIVAFIPAINILDVFLKNTIISILVSAVCCAVIYFLNDFLYKVFSNKRNRIIILIAFVILMVSLSFIKTGSIFNIDAFIANRSEFADMELDYLHINWSNFSVKDLYKIISVLAFIIFTIFSKSELKTFVLVIIIAIFNPFCIGFLSEVNSVFYRAFEIILNPGTLCIFVHYAFEKINNKYVTIGTSLLVVIGICLLNNPLKPLYYHDSFIPREGYDNLNKMMKSEKEVIDFLRYDVNGNNIESPYILTTNKLTFAEIPYGRYIFARHNKTYNKWNENELKLFNLFYPDGNDSSPVKRAQFYDDYNNIEKIIEGSDIDYIVINRKYLFYNAETDEYYYLQFLLNRNLAGDICYTNDDYLVYRFR